MSDGSGHMRVPVERECFIPVPKCDLFESLAGSITDMSAREQFIDFGRLIEGIYHFEFHEMANELKQDFRRFEAGGEGTGNLAETEERFLLNFGRLMKQGNFRPLTQADIDVAEAEEYLFNLPVQIDWDKLDTEMLGRFYAQHPHADGGKPPEFANRILIYHRGVGVDRYVGLLTIQKIDVLISNLLVGIWRLGCRLCQAVGLIEKEQVSRDQDELVARPIEVPRSLAPEPAAAPEVPSTSPPTADNSTGYAIVQDEEPPPPEVPQMPAPSTSKADSQERFIERITLRGTGVNFASLFRRTRIQEPTFQELIILFRFAETDAGDQVSTPDQAIHIKAFRDIPMADLEVVFPEKRISMKPLDLVKLVITGTIGLVVAVTKLVFSAALNPVIALAALGTMIGYAGKIFIGFKTSRDRYQHLVTNSLYHKNLDNNLGVIFYLMDSLEEQEYKEAVLGYYFLWQQGEATEDELDERCEAYLKETYDVDVDFEVDDALEKLVRDGLVTQSGERYRARPLEEALRRLDEKWDNYFQYNSNSGHTS